MNGIGKQGVKLENRVGNEWNWKIGSEIKGIRVGSEMNEIGE